MTVVAGARLEALRPRLETRRRKRMMRMLSSVLWPAFLMAGVTEMLIFAHLDPQELLGDGEIGRAHV